MPDEVLPPAIPEIDVDARLRHGVRPDRYDVDRPFPRAYDFAVAEDEHDRIWVGGGSSFDNGDISRHTAYPTDARGNGRLIVHGTAYGRPYAWVELPVELPDGVFDPGFQRFYDRVEWSGATGAEAQARYTVTEANRLIMELHSYGPWPRQLAEKSG